MITARGIADKGPIQKIKGPPEQPGQNGWVGRQGEKEPREAEGSRRS